MSRIMAIDYGLKRVGVAVTDPNNIIATGLTTVRAVEAISFIRDYASREKVGCIVVGEPKQADNTDSAIAGQANAFVRQLKKVLPGIPVERYDERFTSKLAMRALIDSGASRKDRQNKELIDMTSAVILLQSYLESRLYKNKGII